MSHTALRNPLGELVTDTQSVSNVDTDGSGQFTVTFGGIRRILGEDPSNVSAHSPDGFVINVASVTGNQVTFELYRGGGADTELAAFTGGTDVTDINATAVGE